MARASSDAGVREALASAGLSTHQQSLLQAVLRSLDSGSGFGFHAATADSALVALIRAHDALRSHATHGQPNPGLLQRVLRTNESCVRSALMNYPVGNRRVSLEGAADELAATAVSIATKNSQTRAEANTSATALESAIDLATKALDESMRIMWESATTDFYGTAKAATEIAVSVYIRGRDFDAMKIDLIKLLQAGRPTAAQISALLWPPLRRHYLTSFVSGTRSLDRLDEFIAGARQWRISSQDHGTGSWPSSEILRELLKHLDPLTRTGVLIRVPIDAADLGTAAVLGRRSISELLDQYVAGNRIADLTLADPWLVTGPDGRTKLGETVKAGVTRAVPLSASWSDGLRPALRIAHIAQRVEAPMTSAALCWSAIESMGLAAANSNFLARACALHLLRQQILDTHTQLRLMGAENLRRLRSRASTAKGRFERSQAILTIRSRIIGTTTLEIEQLTVALAQAEQKWLADALAEQRITTQTARIMETLDAHVPRTQRQKLLEPDRWLDLLLPATDSDDAALTAARESATVLEGIVGGLAEATMLVWRERLATPQLLAEWLRDKERTCHATLEWLYATRNFAFHSGRFNGPLDIATAHAGRAIVDILLEIFDRWHSTQNKRGDDVTAPAEIAAALSSRTELLISNLSRATSCRPLSIQHISGPDDSFWEPRRHGNSATTRQILGCDGQS